ncbi:Calcium-dependent protein kinase 20 [Tetrabaena socialis]|uniref:Calcium-dependent protein kinase 20 n=1 Tax=Tetrabaena socialis TaxID=47790 RepID=A0A2J7ZRW5_9CHLO|nr:Calcium-dependent protein kinase 20 [Tetrabaena socialis]|eukprot:PNH03014.1 Calcium-dependent protein kinase 20 [Tetrabaena socialis]
MHARVYGAQVRSAVHLVSGARVAVKTIRKSLLAAADVSSLRREVEILHHLAGHPHISQLLGVFEEATQLHLVLELYQDGQV